ncbi:hypothetical protein TWF106_007212 [Orbilia oligospora]|uniref:Uncharacterized protein n=1 Tax=Orbilia oligospora TaxID=2813651 RepID=A0A7C8U489_ORBOL|nr:hypothetical protein TWF788_000457 [Orbilia oligospora]KAF3219098.1 hypothetical protein TWF106_007212 [Orbilia oligospora]
MTNLSDLKRQFPRGLGEPITRHRYKRVTGEVFGVFEGGPVDLKDPDVLAVEVATKLRVHPYSPATPEEVYLRAKSHVKGIIYDGDKTFRYFVWLTCSRTYQRRPAKKRFCGEDCDEAKSTDDDTTMGDVLSGPSGPSGSKSYDNKGKGKKNMREEEEDGGEMWTKIVKVPFLVWMGSPCSFLSFDAVDVFFSGPEFEYSRYQLSVDGTPFLFHAPDDHSNFNHHNILGRDFLESRFRTFEADYSNLSVLLRRRKYITLVPGQPLSYGGDKSGTSGADDKDNDSENGESGSGEGEGEGEEWVKQRDEDLERFLEEDEEDEEEDEEAKDGEEGNIEGLRRVEGGVEASIDPRLLQWGSRQERAEDRTEDQELDDLEKQMAQMQQEHEKMDQQIMDVRQAVQRFERQVGLNVPEGGEMRVEEEDKREEGAEDIKTSEFTGNTASAGTSCLRNDEDRMEMDAENNVEMKDSEGSLEPVDPELGLREMRNADRDGFPPPPSAPISRKEEKRSSLVSKENLKVSGGRTGSGMRR